MNEIKHKLQQEDINSMDLNSDTLAKLKQILPEVFTEGTDGKPSLDIERLKIALGGAVDVESDNKSRFSFGWSGKKQAQALANQPSTATLRPSVEDSKNWDNTQNVYIEGDNLEVLKLLQKSYYGQIKMIYIDPPYNTGDEFVYKDNFHDKVKNYLQLTGQVDNDGNIIGTNTDKNGRYHTDWLNMMYPRLKLARNLLKNDGVIFISIDDNEVHNLRKICDEIFGEDNLVGIFSWKNKYGAGAKTRGFIEVHEYILCYSKTIIEDISAELTPEQISEYDKRKDDKYRQRGGYITQPLMTNSLDDRPKLKYSIFHDGIEIKPRKQWVWEEPRLLRALKNDEVVIKKKKNGEYSVRAKVYLRDELGKIRLGKPITTLNGPFNQDGTSELSDLLGDGVFSFPKPTKLLIYLLSFVINNKEEKSGIYLDFFSGSATTSNAVMQLNASDGGNRKYICIQLPETTYDLDKEGNEVPKKKSIEAYKAGYKNICEIGKERIRRAGEKVFTDWTEKQQKSTQANANAGLFADDAESDAAQTSLDIGFKVFKLDTSNIKPFDSVDMFADDLLVANRSALDLFYELVLKQGYSLDNRQCVLDIGGTRCYALVHEDNTPFVLAVLDDTVKPNFALELLKYALTLVIVKDACFGTDEIKLNLLATLEQLQSKDNPLQIRII